MSILAAPCPDISLRSKLSTNARYHIYLDALIKTRPKLESPDGMDSCRLVLVNTASATFLHTFVYLPVRNSELVLAHGACTAFMHKLCIDIAGVGNSYVVQIARGSGR